MTNFTEEERSEIVLAALRSVLKSIYFDKSIMILGAAITDLVLRLPRGARASFVTELSRIITHGYKSAEAKEDDNNG